MYPFLYNDTKLDVENVGFIIVQVKNASSYQASNHKDTFKKMDPFQTALLTEEDKRGGKYPIPIIWIIFSLSVSGEPAVTHMTYKPSSEGAASLDEHGRPLFTSYDFVCSGVGPGILQPVKKSPGAWEALVNKNDPWESFYRVTTPDLLRSQLPGHGSHRAHFKSWNDDPTIIGCNPS